MPHRRCVLALALAWFCVGDAALGGVRHEDITLHRGHAVVDAVSAGHDSGLRDGHDSELQAVEVDAAMEAVVMRLLRHKGKPAPSHRELTKEGLQKVNLKVAAERLEGKLPADMATLVRVSIEGKSKQPFEESSLEKARKVLNELIQKAWKDLDDKVIECKEFEEKNRGTFDQVMTDIARLGETIADMMRIKGEAQENINVKEQEIMDAVATLKKETEIYTKIRLENTREITIRKNDMAVFQFMMTLTKCKKAALLQVDDSAEHPAALICETKEGLEINFDDAKAQAELERKMTPGAKQAIREVLGRVQAAEAKVAAGLLQRQRGDDDGSDDDVDEGKDTKTAAVLGSLGVEAKAKTAGGSTTATTTMGVPTPPVPKVKVIKRVPEAAGSVKCPKEPPDCGLLHDNMSLMWGKFKDLVDELQSEMDKNEFEFKELESNLNQQIDVLRNSKARFTMELNEAVANMNAAQEELSEKEDERRELEAEYQAYMKACRKRIAWILYQDICAFLSVRGSVMEFSKVSPPEKITDCDITDWTPAECSVSCDDACPDPLNPYACGGWQTISREVIVAPNEFGYKCPELSRKKKCNQFKCPVDCLLSKYSGFTACSRDCEGGVQGRTRSILVPPKNGGMKCNTVQESRPCNTGTCDRNCRLKRWSKWSPCSVACGGGFQEKWRRVTRPTRGNGRCPSSTSRYRYRMQKCNQHDCNGDEICIANQDLVIAIDGSGSLTENGWKVLKGFAAKLIDKYQGQYYGAEDMKIGVVQFGQGEIMPDGNIAKADAVLALTSDIAKVKAAVEGLQFLKGFTNMAQAFTAAESSLLLGGRRKAQSAVMVLTDGKPSFLFQTHEKVMQLKDKHVKLFFAPVVEFAGDELDLMKKWASQPWETHLVHIPGLEPLQADEDIFAQKMIVKFCPEAMSPSAMMFEESELGYMLVREQGSCGARGKMLSKDVLGAAECAALAEGAGAKAFSLGIRFARGRCYAEGLAVTKEMIEGFEKDRANPPCSAGDWEYDALYDFYVLETL